MAAQRDVILLYLRYGIYDSPVPATFTREVPYGLPLGESSSRCHPKLEPGKHYEAEEVTNLILASEFWKGSTGLAHSGKIAVESSDGKLHATDVVAKVSLHSDDKAFAEHEYTIYQRLN